MYRFYPTYIAPNGATLDVSYDSANSKFDIYHTPSGGSSTLIGNYSLSTYNFTTTSDAYQFWDYNCYEGLHGDCPPHYVYQGSHFEFQSLVLTIG